jgi:undecaprenyl-diphosphatase
VGKISLWEGLLLGAVQGVTEFLPVSSSGHLILARSYFKMEQLPLLFDVLLHVATLLVVLFHYRVLIGKLLISFFRFLRRKNSAQDKQNLNLISAVLVATTVTVMMALIFRKFNIEATSTLTVSILMLITAVLLFSTKFIPNFIKQTEKLGPKQALMTGIGQGFGVLAGISRSGITITAALFSGMKRKEAGDFAFILSIPAILGALVLTLFEEGAGYSVALIPTIGAFITAFVVGLFSLRLLLWMIKNAHLWYFSLYLVIIGTFGLFSSM